MSEVSDDTLVLLCNRSRRLSAYVRLKLQGKTPVPNSIIDAELKRLAESVKQYQMERAVEAN